MFGRKYRGVYKIGDELRRMTESAIEALEKSGKLTPDKREAMLLEDRLNRVLYLSMGVWELLRERTDLTDDDLQAKIDEIPGRGDKTA
jgi:hypothetical protein